MLTTIVAQTDPLAVITLHEVECLAAEIFANTFGLDWGGAIAAALASIIDLAVFSSEWDNAACIQGNLDACPF